MPALLLQIRDLRLGAEIFEEFGAARRLGQLRYAALWIVEIAEHDRRRRTGLGARRLDRAVRDRLVLRLRRRLRGPDALHAEGALLHHADFTHRDVGIELQVQRLVPLGVEEVEEAHVVGAGVPAIARTDAAVVDLRVQSVFVVMRRIRRTYRFARRVVALLTQDGTKLHAHIRKITFEVALDAKPVHGAAARGLAGADGR